MKSGRVLRLCVTQIYPQSKPKQSVEEDCRSAEDIVQLVPARPQAFCWSIQHPAGTFPP
jgi:hypothetical protein